MHVWYVCLYVYTYCTWTHIMYIYVYIYIFLLLSHICTSVPQNFTLQKLEGSPSFATFATSWGNLRVPQCNFPQKSKTFYKGIINHQRFPLDSHAAGYPSWSVERILLICFGAEELLRDPPESKNRFWPDHSDGIVADVHGLRDEHAACQFVNVSWNPFCCRNL